tara:strand:- start:2924 stop:3652 length:729 start_codon:yes stop_codon:yes gene_type:complete
MRAVALMFLPFMVMAANPVIDGVELSKEEKIKDVLIRSGEKSDSIIYLASYKTQFDGSFDKALEYVLDFPKRCNNSYKKERKLTAKDFECVYHNDNLIESQIVKQLKVEDKNPAIVDRFVVKRRIWNKGLHSYNDLVTVTKQEPKENEVRRLTVSYRLLKDEESKSLIEDPVPFDNAFYYTVGTYRMAETKDGKVTVDYTYETKTDHWFLTSSMVQGSIFESIAKGSRYAVDGIQGALTNGK